MPPASMMSPLYVRTSSKDVFWLWCGLFSRVAPLQQAFQEERARLMGEINSVRGGGFARARLAVLLICVVNVVTDTCGCGDVVREPQSESGARPRDRTWPGPVSAMVPQALSDVDMCWRPDVAGCGRDDDGGCVDDVS